MSGWSEHVTPEGYTYFFNESTGETTWDKPAELQTEDDERYAGDWVWMPHEEYAFLPAKVVSGNAKGRCELETEDGQVWNMDGSKTELIPVTRLSLTHLQNDLVLLDDMNIPLIMHNLKERCKKNLIYTNVGTILISINPYKMLPLYTPSMMHKYQTRGESEVEPHPYIIADNSYRALFQEDGLNQSILVSGESGAGKTENTKIILQYLAETAGSKTGVEQQILLANPVLEAFGNAKTIRNNNSSRFGKWIEVHFERGGKITGARIENYLLEKARVVRLANGERNFHIFYQIFKDSNLKQKYKLTSPEDYFYTNQSACTVQGLDDDKEYTEMREAMKVLKFSDEEVEFCFRTVAAILHLGNINFEETGSGVKKSKIKNPDELKHAAELFGVNANQLGKALVERIMIIPGQDPTTIPLDGVKARDCRDTLAKMLYSRMFDYIVMRINTILSKDIGNQKTSYIGILDIFGFEIFDKNSFEQLCINFANEKLQQKFNQTTFKEEEAVYRREAIKFDHVEFIDNQAVLDLVEKKPEGILVLLDDEIRMPKGGDESFLDKIERKHKDNPRFKKSVKVRNHFKIIHYAGEVSYDVLGFYDKNKDEMYMDLVGTINGSSVKLIKSMVASEAGQRERTKISLSGQFRSQLVDLMKKINRTEPHYIRCVKPNENKAPSAEDFDTPMSMRQLRYAGVFEAVQIRRHGYPFRFTHKKFMKRYQCLNLQLKGRDKASCVKLLGWMKSDKKVDTSDVQVGKSMILYRAREQRNMDLIRNVAVRRLLIRAQALYRRFRMRCQYDIMNTVRHRLRSAMKARSIEQLGAALKDSNDMPFQIKEHYESADLKHYLEEEIRLNKLLTELFGVLEGVSDPSEDKRLRLAKAIEDGEKISMGKPPHPANDIFEKGANMLLRINMRIEARRDMAEGTKTSDEELLLAAVEKAKQYGVSMDEAVSRAALAELERIKQEKVLLEELGKCLSLPEFGMCQGVLIDKKGNTTVSDAQRLRTAIGKGQSFNCKTARGKLLMRTAGVLQTIRDLIAKDDWDSVNTQVIQANEMDIIHDAPELKAAQDQVILRAKIEQVQAELDDAAKAFDSNALDIAIQKGVALEMDVKWYQDLYNGITAAHAMCQEALKKVDLKLLKDAVEYSDSFGYNLEEVKQTRELRDKVDQIEKELQPMIVHIPERPELNALDQRIKAVNYVTKDTQFLDSLIALDDESLCQKQFDAAVKEKDDERIVQKKIQLKDFFFAKHGTNFKIADCPLLKTPSDYAKPKTFGKKKLKKTMLLWSKQPMPGSLTQLQKLQEKEAKLIHKNMLGFMGDKQISFPAVLAKEILDKGLASDVMRDEIFLQQIKQLTMNPNPESIKKGWFLMHLCLKTFPPTDRFENYLEIWLRNEPHSKSDDKYLKSMHGTIFKGPAQSSPSPEDIERIQREG